MNIVLDTNCLVIAISRQSEYHQVWKDFLAGKLIIKDHTMDALGLGGKPYKKIKRVCHKSMAHPLLCYLLHNPRSIVAYFKKGIILYRLQILLFPIFSIINRQEVHKRA